MKNLNIADTKNTPEVSFDIQSGVFSIVGESYPETAMVFYQEVIDWLKAFSAQNTKPVEMNFKLSYLNTSSSKCILNIINVMEAMHGKGVPVKVNWYYKEDDEDMKISGDEFAEDMTVQFNVIQQ